MAKSKDINDPAAVTAYIQKLDTEQGKLVQMLREIILDSDKSVGEQIKWNAPTFFYTGEMKPFDPKEYKRDIVVMNLRKGPILLIFPTGMNIKDTTGLLEGNYDDGRRIATFTDMSAAASRKKDLQSVIRDWVSLVDQ